MALLSEFFRVYVMYCRELWLTLAVGFLISGLFFKFIPTDIVEKHLGERGIKPILISSFVGILLPVCCIGSLPIALTLKRKGATQGAVLAFMVATPATSISALVVCWKLMGLTFTLYIFVVIIIIAIIMGVLTNCIKLTGKQDTSLGEEINDHKPSECCDHTKDNFGSKIKEVIVYAFVTLPKEIGVEILIGIAIASFITVFEPIQHLIREYLTGMVGYLFILAIGLVTYVCSTASVPMADAFLRSGMSYGQALCYLLVGPITSYGTILVIKKDFGLRVLMIYLSVICVLSLLYGILYDVLIR